VNRLLGFGMSGAPPAPLVSNNALHSPDSPAGCVSSGALEACLVILLSPFAPHITEELWSLLGNTESVSKAQFPEYVEAYTVENTFEYPVSFNGKMRFKMELSKSLSPKEVEQAVRENENTAKYVGENGIKKVIVVPGKIINVVC
ncbi:MAG: class I tRNA ligase family protein, partial [Bacteroidales bacterium]|nr:class I tRNA ligase family protein [Bacteroidales bacterium]